MASNLRNLAMSPQKGTSGHLSPCDNSGKKGGVVGAKQKKKKSTTAKNNHLKKKQRPHNTLTNVVPNSCYPETAWPMWACACMHETTDHYKANSSIMDLDVPENQHLFVVS